MTDKELTQQIIGAAIEVHRLLGPGLLEPTYEECLCHERTPNRLPFERQKTVPVVYKGVKLDCGYRLDLLVSDRVILELKIRGLPGSNHDSVLRLSGYRIGLLMIFNVPIFKDGIRRLVFRKKPF